MTGRSPAESLRHDKRNATALILFALRQDGDAMADLLCDLDYTELTGVVGALALTGAYAAIVDQGGKEAAAAMLEQQLAHYALTDVDGAP